MENDPNCKMSTSHTVHAQQNTKISNLILRCYLSLYYLLKLILLRLYKMKTSRKPFKMSVLILEDVNVTILKPLKKSCQIDLELKKKEQSF